MTDTKDDLDTDSKNDSNEIPEPHIMAVESVLGQDGMLSQILDDYESRPQQLEMAGTVAQAISEVKHAIIEAPTGVGKSFAYLVPAAKFALQHNKKIVIYIG